APGERRIRLQRRAVSRSALSDARRHEADLGKSRRRDAGVRAPQARRIRRRLARRAAQARAISRKSKIAGGVMARFKTFSKVLPAANLPMMPDEAIDEEAYRKHLRWLLTHDIGGLVISGHAGELESLTPQERIRVAELARKEIPDKLPMVVGCTGLSTRELVECAKDAKAAGADGLLVMPIPHFAFGAVDRP